MHCIQRPRHLVIQLSCLLLAWCITSTAHANLILTAVFDGPLTGGEPKIIELFATSDIADLGTYGVESATNSAGATAIETSLSGAISAGEFLYVYQANQDPGVTPIDRLTAFLGFTPAHVIHDSSPGGAATFNGDDSIILWNGAAIIDRFGNDADADNPGEDWDYQDGWAYRVDGTGPDNPFVMDHWMLSGENVNDGEFDNASASVPFPVGTYSTSAVPEPSSFVIFSLLTAICVAVGARRKHAT